MTGEHSKQRGITDNSASETAIRKLRFICCLLLIIFSGISSLSFWFAWGSSDRARPIVLFLTMMTTGFVLHLAALRIGLQLRRSDRVAGLVLGAGILFRLLLLPSHPILEIDIYRYMWDGLVVTQGVSPYRFNPAEVLACEDAGGDDGLQELISLRDSSPAVGRVLSRVHYEHLTTIYPPVSQSVFAVAAWIVPLDASARCRLIVTKLAITVFDVLTMLAVLLLLRHFRKPDAWLICYAWSPLVLKEFANSGHLDAIAICLATWAILFWLKALRQHSLSWLTCASVMLGLGIGAKIYPIVLVPVIAVTVVQRLGIQMTLVSGTTLLAVSSLALAPMWRCAAFPGDSNAMSAPKDATQLAAEQSSESSDNGFTAFMSSWRMNDVFFMTIQENLKPNSKAWFSVLPENVRRPIRGVATRFTGSTGSRAAFVVSRFLTALLHLLLAGWLARRALHVGDWQLPRLLFLTVAWFWLLLPTLNPWYWIWALPLIPFARHRTWLLLSGVVVVYYFRFWLQYHVEQIDVAAFRGSGTDFYDYVVVWFEYMPFLTLLLCEWMYRRRSKQIDAGPTRK